MYLYKLFENKFVIIVHKKHLRPPPWTGEIRPKKGEVPIQSPLTNCWGKQEVYTEGVVIVPEWGLPAPPQSHMRRDYMCISYRCTL